MKRTVNINMGQRLFVIDEDAYSLLSEYLDTLRTLFANTPGQEETAADIEFRAAELFAEFQTNSPSPSISKEQVQQVIARLGSPEEIIESNEAFGNSEASESITESCSASAEEGTGSTPPPYGENNEPKKKFYRNPDDRVIGGVCSGIAAYFGLDVSWVRVAVILLAIFSFSTCAIVYVVLCCVIPEAKTPLQRMQLYGEAPTLANVGRNFANMANNTFDNVRNYAVNHRSGFSEFLNTVVKLFAIIAIVITALVGLGCSIGILVLAGCILALVVCSIWPNWTLVSSWNEVLVNLHQGDIMELSGSVFILLAILIPVSVLGVGLYRSLIKKKTISSKSLIIWSVIWVFTLAMAIILFN